MLGCGIPTGIGAALNTAKVEPDSTCAVWGCGAVGLAAIMGCKMAGAKDVVAVDKNGDKRETAIKFGASKFISTADTEKPIQEQIAKDYEGGFDYTFECIGNVNTMRTALV